MPADYIADLDEPRGRERRFLGWFLFDFTLPDGQCPAELAARTLLKGRDLGQVLEAVRNTRYVIANVVSVLPGQGLRLDSGDEEFELSTPVETRARAGESTFVGYVVPVSPGRYIPGPGWTIMAVALGSGIMAFLKEHRPGAIETERFLQQRMPGGDVDLPEPPQDDTFEAAVSRMTRAARETGQDGLVMSQAQWKQLVMQYLPARDVGGFVQEVAGRMRPFDSLEEANRWLHLATNIWNNTPQPDRGGRSASDLARDSGGLHAAQSGSDPRFKLMSHQMAKNLARLGGRSLRRMEQQWRQNQETKTLPLQTTLQAALNKLPGTWIDGIARCLGLQEQRRRNKKVRGIVSFLTDPDRLLATVAVLDREHRQALRYLLDRGGWVDYGELTRKFGDESGDGWWWGDEPPRSVPGMLRLRGLLFVGRAQVDGVTRTVALVPAELRQSLSDALAATKDPGRRGVEPIVAAPQSYEKLGKELGTVKLHYGEFATEDHTLETYWQVFDSYWHDTQYAQDRATDGFGVEEYLWRFRLPGSRKSPLERFLLEQAPHLSQEIRRGLPNWQYADLRCCRILAARELVLLQDLETGRRMWCFTLALGGAKSLRPSAHDLYVGYVSPWNEDACCLMGYAMLLRDMKQPVEACRHLRSTLRDTTRRTIQYCTRLERKAQTSLSDIPEPFLKAFRDRHDL
jgi:hypothetical protein